MHTKTINIIANVYEDLLSASQALCYAFFTCRPPHSFLTTALRGDNFIIPILQMRTLRLRIVR